VINDMNDTTLYCSNGHRWLVGGLKFVEHLVKWMVFNFGCAFWFAAVQYLDLFLCQLQRFSIIAIYGQGWPRDLSHSCAGDCRITSFPCFRYT